MRRLLLAAPVALAVALMLVATASADPYRMRNRAALEKAVARQYVDLAWRKQRERVRVRSIGCAKGGVGRVYCAIVATGRDEDRVDQVTLTCPTDSGVGCTLRILPWR